LSNVVAVAGQQSDLRLLESILHISSDEILDSLDEILAVRLLRESGLAFRFVHPMFHEAVYQQMSQTRRRYLHGEVAQALEALHREDPEPLLDALADHYLKSDRPALALPYLIKAGERAAALYAHETAIRYFQQALQMDDGSHVVQLHECLGDQAGMLGNEQKSAAHYEAALAALAGRAGDAANQRPLHRKAAYRYTLAGDLESASRHLEAATHLTPEARDLEWVRLQYALAHYHWQKNEFAEASAIAQESLAVAEALGAEADAAKAYEMMALCCVPLGEWRQGLHYEAQRLSLVDLNRYLADVSDVHL
jgi:tetratricopeptide (TPR) repeat protein